MPRQKSTHVDSPGAVGARLREARERAGLSQRQLAFDGCTPAYLSRIEAGQRIPSLQLLRQIGQRLGVSADYLATGAQVSEEAALASTLLEAEVHLRLDELEPARELFTEAMERAERRSDRADATIGLGRIAQREGRMRDAATLFEDALELLAGEIGGHPELAESLGQARLGLGDVAGATTVFRACLERARDEGDQIETKRFAWLLGSALVEAGEGERARQVLATALDDADAVIDPHTRARLYWTASRRLVDQGAIPEATTLAHRALETLRLAEDAYAFAHAHQLLATVEARAGETERAAELLRHGRLLAETTGSPVGVARFEIEQARTEARSGRESTATALAASAARRLADVPPLPAGQALTLLGEAYEELGDLEAARDAYERAVAALEQVSPTRYLVEANTRLSGVLERLARPEDALAAMRKAFGAQDRLATSGS